MAVNMKLWQIKGDTLKEVASEQLEFEHRLEEWIAKDSSLLGSELLIIGRQVPTGYGGRIDLLGIDRQGDLVVIELKRDRTPRDVVAQVLDYASWVRGLEYAEVNAIASSHCHKPLPEAFADFFDETLPEQINGHHRMLVVASEFDDSSERIVQYLAEEHKVNINAIFFSCFRDDAQGLLGRAWLMDPDEVQDRSETRRAPWSGYWFVNVGDGPCRRWEDNVKYGYVGAGQGPKYSGPLKKLEVGNELFAYMKGLGYVGYGVVRKPARMIRDAVVEESGLRLLDMPLEAPEANRNSEDPELSEWVVGVDWKRTTDRDRAKSFKGVFANQNVVCKLRHPETVEFLKREFGVVT